MNKATIFYPGMLKTYKECPYKYKLKYTDNLEIPQNQVFSESGRRIHALANFYLNGQDISKLEGALDEKEHILFEKLKNNTMFNKLYVNSEYNLSAKIGDFWISGRLDALVKDSEGYYILDYKTGKVPQNPEYDFQTIFYLTILSAFLKCEKSESLNFVYIDLKNDKDIVINLNTQLLAEYKEIITNTCNKITTDKNFEAFHKSCKFCEYSRFCLKFIKNEQN